MLDVKLRIKKKITEKSTYMAKKSNFERCVEEIRKKFPGEIKRTLTKTGRPYKYYPTEEQELWMIENVGKKYTYHSFSVATGLTSALVYRVMAKHDVKAGVAYLKLLRDHRIARKKLRESATAELIAKVEEKKKKCAAYKKPKKEKKKVWLWDLEQAKLRKEMEAKARQEQKEREKAELEEERKNHECYEKLKDRVKRPKPFTDEEAKLRRAAYERNYILPSGEELMGDRRKCIYWDEVTKRTKWIEAEADRLKFSVIEYRKMFPYNGNNFSSCRGSEEKYKIYQ